MKIDFEGRVWDLDMAHIGYKHAMGIQSHTGLSIAEWADSLDLKLEPGSDGENKLKMPGKNWLPSLAALYWLMRQQNGDTVAFDGLDFDYQEFNGAYLTAVLAEMEAALEAAKAKKAAEADPTSPPSTTPEVPSPEPATPATTTPRRRARDEEDDGTGSG